VSEATETPIFEVRIPDPPPPDKFEQERRAFRHLLPDLLKTHEGQFVAIHNGQVVDSGPDRLELVIRVQARVQDGIYVGLVSDEPEPPRRSGIRRVLGGSRTRP
jgi:hypothetical protein